MRARRRSGTRPRSRRPRRRRPRARRSRPARRPHPRPRSRRRTRPGAGRTHPAPGAAPYVPPALLVGQALLALALVVAVPLVLLLLEQVIGRLGVGVVPVAERLIGHAEHDARKRPSTIGRSRGA